MNRTERMLELAVELRMAAPRSLTARELAARFDVTERTIERDLEALAAAGIPVEHPSAPGGGYRLAADVPRPEIVFTPSEATAVAVALAAPGGPRLGAAGHSAREKVTAALVADGPVREIRLPDTPDIEAAVEKAISSGRVLALRYLDRNGELSHRVVEPLAIVRSRPHWYLVAWCRLREDGRGFRSDRIREAVVTDEPMSHREFRSAAAQLAASLHAPPFVE